MLKQTVKNLTDKVLPGSKFSSDPTLASEVLVDQIGARTSILSGFAEKTSKALTALSSTNTIRLEAAKEYSAKNLEGEFGKEFRKQNPNISEDKVEKEMLTILMQLHKLLDNHTREEFNNSLLYKKYATYFDEYKKNLAKSLPDASSEAEPKKTYSNLRDAASEKILDKLTPEKTPVDIPESTEPEAEVTPEKTPVDIPEKNIHYSDSDGYFSDLPPEVTPEKTPVDIPESTEPEAEVTPEKTPVDIPEKKTYSSIRDAASEKILDKILPGEVTPEKSEETSIFAKVLGSVKPNDGADPEDSTDPVVAELKKTNHFLEEMVKIDKKNSALHSENSAELSEKEINEANDKVKPEKSNSILDSLKDKALNASGGLKGAAKTAGKGLSTAGKVLATGARLAAPALLGAAAVGATGYGAYKAGEWLNENTGIQAGISDGIDSVKGWFGNSDEDKMKEADKQSAQVLYDKRVSEGKLTDKNASFFEKQGIKVDKSKIVKLPDAVKSPIVAAVVSNIETKDTAAATPPTVQPILLNNNNSKSSPEASPRQLISGMNVRNSETTFERVQMQDFWPRTK